MKNIVVVGGGFAGINLAKNINSKKYNITLLDRNNYIFFPPLLYQVATGFLEPSAISYPFRKMLSNKPNIRFKLGEVTHVDLEQNKLFLTTGELDYDYLVFATGTETNYFGMQNVKENAIPMKTVNDALEMRNHFLHQMEKATTLLSEKEKLTKKLTLVIAGGGPTGVELAGMFAEMQTSIMKKDYPEFKDKSPVANIFLVDGEAQLLTPMSEKSQTYSYDTLLKLGVNIVLNARVTDYLNGEVILNNGEIIESENLIWAAGVVSQVFEGIPVESYGRGKRLIADAYHKVQNVENVFAIGDTSIQQHEKDFLAGHPQVAQVALQQGKNLAKNFDRLAEKKVLVPFTYKDKGSMAIIGRNKAVADLPPKWHFKGFLAWFMWVFIHIISLVHYRNKIITFFRWLVAYFTKDQALRMMIRPTEKQDTLEKG